MQQFIDRADCVLAIITTDASQMVQHELRYALDHRKLVSCWIQRISNV